MGFYLSPSVNVRERDLSTTIPAVATSITGVVGNFAWGPCNERVLLTQDRLLSETFGLPKNDNYEHWFSVWNFLQYGNTIYVVRMITEAGSFNSGLKLFDGVSKVRTLTHGTVTSGPFVVGDTLTGDTSGASAEILEVNASSVVVKMAALSVEFSATEDVTSGSKTATLSAIVNNLTDDYKILKQNEEDSIALTYADHEKLAIVGKFPGDEGNKISIAIANPTDFATANVKTGMAFSEVFDYAPEGQEFAVAVLKRSTLTGESEIVETFIASLDEEARDFEGNNIYVEELINRSSKYIWMFEDSTNTGGVASIEETLLTGGVAVAPDTGEIMLGYDLFADPEEIDVNIIIDGGNTASVIQQYIVDSVVEKRKDCVAILNVPKNEVVGVANISTAVTNVVDYRLNTLSRNSSYAAFYGNWKKQYDKFNDVYRWLPCSGDIAGVYAYTDYTRDPWFAPAGLNRGQVKNVVKFAYNPNRGFRDILYKNGINPLVNFPGDGPVIWGQKTLQVKPSAFDRIDVRRLFIVLEKAISTAAKYFLFEKNTSFTRRQIIGAIEPFLRDVQGREGVYDFMVLCDETNNTPEIIDRNELACDIYIKPTRTAEFIQLTFIATKTSVNFTELLKVAA